MDFVKEILGDRAGQLVAALVQKTDLDAGQAAGFLPPAVQQLVRALGAAKLDPAALLGGGGLGDLLGRVDTGEVAREAGVPKEQAARGLEVVAPAVLEGLRGRSGGIGDLLGALGGGGGGLLGAAGGLAGKLFK